MTKELTLTFKIEDEEILCLHNLEEIGIMEVLHVIGCNLLNFYCFLNSATEEDMYKVKDIVENSLDKYRKGLN